MYQELTWHNGPDLMNVKGGEDVIKKALLKDRKGL